MTDINIRIDGLDNFLAKLSKSPVVVTKHLQRAIEIAGNQFLAGTKQNIKTGREMWKSPIDTGRMWNSLYLTVGNLYAQIRPTVNYAVFVHQGTFKMQARPFFEITERTERMSIERIFQMELNAAMKEIS